MYRPWRCRVGAAAPAAPAVVRLEADSRHFSFCNICRARGHQSSSSCSRARSFFLSVPCDNTSTPFFFVLGSRATSCVPTHTAASFTNPAAETQVKSVASDDSPNFFVREIPRFASSP